MPVLCVLPARLASTRLPGKPLIPIAGRPLIEWTWLAASRIEGVDSVLVATDSEEIAVAVREFGGAAVMTSAAHASGTERVAEVAELPEGRGYDVLVNVQGDEPLLDVESAARAIRRVAAGTAEIATLAAPIESDAEWKAPGVVKPVVTGDGRLLYLSRAPIPHARDDDRRFGSGSPYLRHIGVYVYSRSALSRWVELPPSPLETVEKIEALRALEAEMRIDVVIGPATGPGVDEPDDVQIVERMLSDLEREEKTHV